jgi:hypothetical protein
MFIEKKDEVKKQGGLEVKIHGVYLIHDESSNMIHI